jgi:hypothetical protein
MINEIKEDTYKHLKQFQKYINKKLKKFKDNKIRRRIQDMKNEDVEILKKLK